MNIYHCSRDFSGRDFSAVVKANSKRRATELLEWKKDEDTLSIKVKKIGVADSEKEGIWAEESL